MDKRQENYLLSVFFEKGLSEKVAPVPKWYEEVSYLSFALVIIGIVYLFIETVIGLLNFVIAFSIHCLCYIYRRQKVLKAIRNMNPEQLEGLLLDIQQPYDWMTAYLLGMHGSWLERLFSRKNLSQHARSVGKKHPEQGILPI